MQRKLLLLIVGILAWWGLYLHFAFIGFVGDSVYYLEPARQFAWGHGVATKILHAAQIAVYPDGLKLPAPFLWHGPLMPMVVGTAFRLFGPVDWVTLVYGFGLTLAAGLLSWRLGRQLGGDGTGLLSAALFGTAYSVMESNLDSMTDPLFTLLIVAGVSCLWESARSRFALRWTAAAGLALGLASCTRLAGQTYWIGFAAATLWLYGWSWKAPAALLAGLAGPMACLMLYNYSAAGILLFSPGFYFLQSSRNFPGMAAMLSYLPLTSLQALLLYPVDVLQKAVTGSLYGVNNLLERSDEGYMAASLLLGLLVRPKGEPARRYKTIALIVALPVVVLNLFLANGYVRYLHPLFPFLLPLAALFLFSFVDEHLPVLRRRPLLGLAVFAYLFMSAGALKIKNAWKARSERVALYDDLARLEDFIASRTSPEETLYADDPQPILLKHDRSAIMLTRTLEDAQKSFRRLSPDALVLTSYMVHNDKYDPAFARAFDQRTPILGYAPCDEFSAGRQSVVIFRKPGACPAGLQR